MILMASPNQQFMSNDSYLRDKSTDIIKLCKERQISIKYKPLVELYPNSSRLYFKNQVKEKYDEFKNQKNILTFNQIYEINKYLNSIVKKIF